MQYVVGPSKNSSKSSNNSAAGKKKEGNKMNEYQKALKDFKLQWIKWAICSITPSNLLSFTRHGVVTAAELQDEFGESPNLLIAALRELDEKEVF